MPFISVPEPPTTTTKKSSEESATTNKLQHTCETNVDPDHTSLPEERALSPDRFRNLHYLWDYTIEPSRQSCQAFRAAESLLFDCSVGKWKDNNERKSLLASAMVRALGELMMKYTQYVR